MADGQINLQLRCPDLASLPEVAEQILASVKDQNIWLFKGEMGAGKTTLIKAICSQLGVEDTVASPSYSIVNEYKLGDGKLFHFDFYRIESIEEAQNIGVEEYFDSGNYCFIEWFAKVDPLLPDVGLLINIEGTQEEERIIDVKTYDRV